MPYASGTQPFNLYPEPEVPVSIALSELPRDPVAPDLTDPSIFPFWSDEHVRFADLDPLGHVNNNAIGVYFENSRVALNRRYRRPAHAPEPLIVLGRLEIDYRAEIHYPNDLRVGIGILRIGRTSWTSGSGLFLGDRCCATSVAVAVQIDPESRRPLPLPDWLRASLTEFKL